MQFLTAYHLFNRINKKLNAIFLEIRKSQRHFIMIFTHRFNYKQHTKKNNCSVKNLIFLMSDLMGFVSRHSPIQCRFFFLLVLSFSSLGFNSWLLILLFLSKSLNKKSPNQIHVPSVLLHKNSPNPFQ